MSNVIFFVQGSVPSGKSSGLNLPAVFFAALFQTHVPTVFEYSAFTHKILLELYIVLKDAGLDVIDEWEVIKKLAVDSSSEETADGELSQSSKKPTEKRRIYSRLGGISAQDVLSKRE